MPPAGAARPIGLYVRVRGGDVPTVVDRAVRLAAGESASFDTYFGAFGVAVWRRHSAVRNVEVDVTTDGHVRVEVLHQRLGHDPVIVASSEQVTGTRQTHTLPVPPLDALIDGSLHVRVACVEGRAAVTGGSWRTVEVPVRPVALGIVITTFNRAAELRENLVRLDRALADRPELAAAVDLVVVDNGRNAVLPPLEALRVTTIASPNTGGAGGFARGLMYLRSEAAASHVLFMDDDVSFDPEIVARTVALLQHATDPCCCVAGAMLANDRPTEIFEAGARFDGTVIDTNDPVGQGLDLDEPRDLLLAEASEEHIDYGAWWYFAFPIDLTGDNPIPAFVRGDDVLWGLLHARGHIITCNGIGLWHESFESKNGPTAWFYETRNLALVGVLAVPGYGSRHLLARYVNLCGRSMLSLKYDSARNITFAVREFLHGPDHWMALDQAALNDDVCSFTGERVCDLPPEWRDKEPLPHRNGIARLLSAGLSVATLGGHLLPPVLDRGSPRSADLAVRILGASTRQRTIVFQDHAGVRGFVAQRDRRRFARLFLDMVCTSAQVVWRFGRLRRAYRAAYPAMVSDDYWRTQFGLGDATAHADAGHERIPA
jgi:glycosyltransferase involved in cell wall biosynthesis